MSNRRARLGRSEVITDGLQIEPGADVEERYGIRTLPTLEAGLALRPDAVLVCNPTSLARDLAAMPSLRPSRARLFDMFPQAAHYEVLTLLERA